jgi:hypothetical protein
LQQKNSKYCHLNQGWHYYLIFLDSPSNKSKKSQ